MCYENSLAHFSNHVKQVIQILGMFLYLLSFSQSLSFFFSICPDPMGEEHHIRRTSGVPPLMVVVSFFCLMIEVTFPLCAVFSSFHHFNKIIIFFLFSFLFISVVVPKRSSSGCKRTHLKSPIPIMIMESYLLPWCWIILLFVSVKLQWFSFVTILSVRCSVFWDLYCAAPERRDTCEHSSEAKAFHDYVSLHWCSFPGSFLISGTLWLVQESMLGDAVLYGNPNCKILRNKQDILK